MYKNSEKQKYQVIIMRCPSLVSFFSDNRFCAFLLTFSWIALFYRSLFWFCQTLYLNYSLQNLILLVLILVALFRFGTIPSLRFSFRWTPFLIILFSVPVYYMAGNHIKMNIISCTICFLSLYGLAGFFLDWEGWKKGIIPVLLIIQTLPYGNQLDIYFGFPLRLHAASTVTDFLAWFNIHGITKETIITIENRSAEVSEACSGLNGLWTAWLFFFAISWIEKRKVGLRWAFLFIAINIMIYSFNLLRIIILVVLETVLIKPEISSMVHIPLGIAGFLFSCLITWLLMNRYLKEQLPALASHPVVTKNQNSLKLLGIIPLTFLMLFISFSFRYPPPQIKSEIQFSPHWPSEINVIEIEKTAGEKNAFEKESSQAVKYRFTYKNLSGSCLLVLSSGWRGHHPPSLCTQANGFTIQKAETCLIQKDMPVQFLHLANSDLKSCYWFQSEKAITQDHAGRVWEALSGKSQKWILISILLNEGSAAFPEDTKYLLLSIRNVVNNYFKHDKLSQNEKVFKK